MSNFTSLFFPSFSPSFLGFSRELPPLALCSRAPCLRNWEALDVRRLRGGQKVRGEQRTADAGGCKEAGSMRKGMLLLDKTEEAISSLERLFPFRPAAAPSRASLPLCSARAS